MGFHEHFLANVKVIRAYQADMGEDTYVICEDGGGRFHLEIRPYQERGPREKRKRRDICVQALIRKARRYKSSEEEAVWLARFWEQRIKEGFSLESLLNPRYYNNAEGL